MEKGQLAKLVLEKIQKKKAQTRKNTPHYQVMQLLVQFQVQHYHGLSAQINNLELKLEEESRRMKQMEEHCLELERNGKKPYPRIIITPDFIASEKINQNIKEFYRKASNTFLREYILKKKSYQNYEEKRLNIEKQFSDIKNKEIQLNEIQETKRKTLNSKRRGNLEQDLRLRSIKSQQENLKEVISKEIEDHQHLLTQYEIKKENIQKRIDWSSQLQKMIEQKKHHIQQAYNPVSYREFVKKIRDIRFKNEKVQRNLNEIMTKVDKSQKITDKYELFLEKHTNLFIFGKSKGNSLKKKKENSSMDIPFRNSSLRKSSVVESPQKINIRDKQYEKSPSTSLGRTSRSEASHLLIESAKKKRTISQSVDLMKQIKQ